MKPDETVSVGHIVAAIAANDVPSKTQVKSQNHKPTQDDGAPSPLTQKTDKHDKHATTVTENTDESQEKDSKSNVQSLDSRLEAPRQPMITFPPRRTRDGRQISLLPADEAKSITASRMEGSSKSQERIAKAPTPKQKFFIKSRARAGSVPLPPRAPLSEREIEAIMLGIAD